MPISVLCPSCRARFNVSEKFAGKQGPCPKCKATITVPAVQEEVKVHAPEEFEGGGRDMKGKLVGKPIAREQTRIRPLAAGGVAGAVLLVLAGVWLGGEFLREMWIARAAGLLLVSPPIVVAAYTFLRNDELEPYRGRWLWIRAVICGLVYAVLWGAFGFIPADFLTGEAWTWFFVAPPFFLVGAAAAHASLDLDFGSGFFHYSFYLIVTLLLRWVAGMPHVWAVS